MDQLSILPSPTPPRPAEALSVPGSQQMAPDLLFHPVFHEAEALAGVSHRKVVHPTGNITAIAAKNLKRGMEVSPDAAREIEETFDAVRTNLRSAASVFMTGDPRAAKVLTQQKAEFRRREADAIKTHFAELRDRSKSTAQQTSALDLMRDIKRLNDHLVAGAAYPVLEASGDLMPSRISEDGGDGGSD